MDQDGVEKEKSNMKANLIDTPLHGLNKRKASKSYSLAATSKSSDVLSGTTASGIHHPGVLEGWLGVHWWNGRFFVLLLTTLAIFAPLANLNRIGSFRYTSALSVALAVVFLVITVGITVSKLCTELTMNLRTSDNTKIKVVGRTSLALCSSVLVLTSLFGFLFFGDATLDDVLANFDTDLGIPYGSLLNDAVRVAHLMLVFAIVSYPLQLNLDILLFPSARPLASDNLRFAFVQHSVRHYHLYHLPLESNY